MAELVTRKQLADLWGVSPSAIDNLVQDGKLKKAGRGVFDLKEATKARGSLRATANRTDRIIRIAREAEAEEAPANLPAEAPGAADLKLIQGGKKDNGKVSEMASTLAKARTTREIYSARTAELDFKQRAGLVIETDKVKHAAANASRLIVARLRAFPARLGPQLAPVTSTPECVKLIEAEVKALIEEFQEMMASL